MKRKSFWQDVVFSRGCWVWAGGVGRDGYGKLKVNGKTVRAHRVAYELANGDIPEGMLVCHSCDTPLCVRPDHLFVGRPSDNSRDMVEKGRQARGESNGRSKLTGDQVSEIRKRFHIGERRSDLAREYEVSWSLVNFIVNGESWKHVS
jgi:hypothetical protein